MDVFDSAESVTAKQVARILLVEDEVDVRESIKLQLEEEGHQVVDTESGSDALALTESARFDIVLTDVMIPDINGIELVQRIMQLPNHPVTVVMTGHGSVEMAVKAIKAGAFDFLSKPFSMDVLSATVASALRVKCLQDENVELKK
nr:response regulator [Nitrospirales bacterium]